MSRRTLRRIYVIATVGVIAVSSPAWGPHLFRLLPGTSVQHVGVVGARFVAPAQVMSLAAIPDDASVWDDLEPVEGRLRAHPLIEEARVRRTGLHSLEIAVTEVEPVALIATPRLAVADADGQVLPLDPIAARLDLPVLGGLVEVDEQNGRLTDPDRVRVLAALGRLARENPEFLGQVSEVHYLAPDAMEMLLVDPRHAERILLPLSNSVGSLTRIETALDAFPGPRPVRSADGRFSDQVVLALEGNG
jgi:hypothetical protein